MNTTAGAMTEADIADVVALTARAFPDPWTEAQFREELHTAHSRTWLTREGADLTGYCTYWRVADEVQILLVAVDPSRQRQGLAKRLLDQVIRAERDGGAALFTLEVAAANAPALALYTSAGFERVGLRKRYYAHSGDDAVLLSLAASTPQ